MLTASQLRGGTAIRHEGQPYKVVSVEYHPGQGKMGGAAHTRLQNLQTAAFWEHSFRAELRFDEIPKTLAGDRAAFLEPGMRLSIEFLEDRPVSVLFPDVLEVKIADTAPPSHQQADSAFKPAVFANGVEVMVPQFIKSGDIIRLDLRTMRYMDRAKAKGA